MAYKFLANPWEWLKLATDRDHPLLAAIRSTENGHLLEASDSYRVHSVRISKPALRNGLFLPNLDPLGVDTKEYPDLKSFVPPETMRHLELILKSGVALEVLAMTKAAV